MAPSPSGAEEAAAPPTESAAMAPVVEAGDAPPTSEDAVPDAAVPVDEAALDEPEPSYDLPTDDAAAIALARGRIAAMVPEELRRDFGLLLYVNKAVEGAIPQQMFIFREDGAGDFALDRRWLVSTGRERHEGYFTETPGGLYKLDPHRFFEVHYSQRWNGVKMPWAMFFDYGYRTERSGLAVHGANKTTVKQLGSRASGGCIRLAPAHAEELFAWIQRDFAGKVPVFAFDDAQGHTDRTGRVARDEAGKVRYADGYRVLLIVDAETVTAPDATAAAEPAPGDLAQSAPAQPTP
ncbi:MAG: L,D-transpeptidase [Alphaproteobacteria bacterium]|nr:L,D-transpeptidase [Alphaproteobacteria bacterium]